MLTHRAPRTNLCTTKRTGEVLQGAVLRSSAWAQAAGDSWKQMGAACSLQNISIDQKHTEQLRCTWAVLQRTRENKGKPFPFVFLPVP